MAQSGSKQSGQQGTAQSFDYQGALARLNDNSLDWKLRISAATDLKDHMDSLQSLDPTGFNASLFPVIDDVFLNTEVTFSPDRPEQRLRFCILEIIQRLPYNEALKAHVADLMRIMMNTLRNDNDENATTCLRIIIELHKNFRNVPALEEYVQPFFDFVRDMLQLMEQNVAVYIDNSDTDTLPYDAGMEGSETEKARQNYIPSMNSFKVLSECPIILVLLFQIYKRFITTNIPMLVPLIIHIIGLRAAAQKTYTAIQGGKNVGINPIIRNKAAFSEFIGAQVKIMSFLAYIIRGFASMLKPKQQVIADSVINLLHDCPSETAAARKELLVAARHILSTDFRSAFVPYIDVMFNEDVLIGTGITSRETLRPLAYSMLADLIHHVRQELSTAQIAKTIRLYTQNMHDSSLAPSIQTMCAKLLLNLIDCIVSEPNRDDSRRLLFHMLDAFTSKFGSLKYIFPKLKNQLAKQELSKDHFIHTEDLVDIDNILPIKTSALADSNTVDVIKDYKFLFKTLILGLKTIVFGIKSCSQPAPDASQVTTKQISQDEAAIFVRLFCDGLSCFQIFRFEIGDGNSQTVSDSKAVIANRASLNAKEEKEIIEHFVTVFTMIEPAVFQEVMTTQIGFLYNLQLEDQTMLSIPQYLLASEAVSSSFASILLHFLMDRFETFGSSNTQDTSLMLRLFKLVFMAVTLFPESNELVLQPHIHSIITDSLRYSSNAQESGNYFLLLRALFRNIGGGRFELLYKEVLPLLPTLLKGLNTLLMVSENAQSRDLFVELCLTVPVRLSVLLPYLGYLMRPLVLALDGAPDLVSQGLRTLELCIDNLTAEFLDPILAPVIKDLMAALWKHLRPLPYNQAHATATLRILGKLGGRNRRILKDTFALKTNLSMEPALQLPMFFESIKQGIPLNVDKGLKLAHKVLKDSSSSDYQQEQAWNFVTGTLPVLVDLREGGKNLAAAIAKNLRSPLEKGQFEQVKVRLESVIGQNRKKEAASKWISIDTAQYVNQKREAQCTALTSLVECILLAVQFEKLREEAADLIINLTRHFTVLKVAEGLGMSSRALRLQKSTFDFIDSNFFFDAVVNGISYPSEHCRLLCQRSFSEMYRVSELLLDSSENAAAIPLFNWLATKFCSFCYSPEWNVKMAGCRGIHTLVSLVQLGLSWILDHVLELLKALLFVLQDIPADLVGDRVQPVKETIGALIKLVESPAENEKILAKQVLKRSNILNILGNDLSNSNVVVRQCIHETLLMLSKLSHISITDLLMPAKQRILSPIFSKPLRALPFSMQIGNIDAVTYCIQLEPSLIDLNDELIRLVHETLALADADDQALTSKASQHKNVVSLTKLRTACVKLLSSAMAFNDFSSSQRLNSIRFRIVQVFFKSLYSKSKDVVDAAKQGLRQAISQQNKLPKELLQTGLRPILLNLSDHKRLTVDGLQGLAKLLELLTNYFKVEIGRKLLDHLQQWASPQILEIASKKMLDDCNEVKIIANILEVIHLLPPTANMFMDDMVKTTIHLEETLCRDISSPFRAPLLKFLKKYPTDSFKYFLVDHICEYSYGRLFASLLSHDDAQSLRDEVIKESEQLMDICFGTDGDNIVKQSVGLLIVKGLLKHNPKWLQSTSDIFQVILSIWQSEDRAAVLSGDIEVNNINEIHRWRHILDILVIYCTNNVDDLDALFEIVDAFCHKAALDFSDVKFFLFEQCVSFSPQLKRAALWKVLQLIRDENETNVKKAQLIRLIAIPVMNSALSSNTLSQILDKEIVGLLNLNIWSAQLYVTNENALSDGLVRLDLLQLTCFVLNHAPNSLSEYRKDIVKFAWHFIKSEDTISRQSAYVTLSYFIRNYDLPGKLVMQIFGGLLKSYQSEARILVRQALDALTSALPQRLGSTEELTGSGIPSWIIITRKILVDMGHFLPQMIAIWQFVIRNADDFYPYRELFLQQLVTSLVKLGLATSSTTDTKILSIDLVELILKWEKIRLEKMKKAEAMDTDDALSPTSSKRKLASPSTPRKRPERQTNHNLDLYTTAQPLREMVVNYLIRFICSVNEPLLRKGQAYRVVQIAKQLLQKDLWHEISPKVAFLEKYFSSTDITENNAANIPNILHILNIIVSNRSAEWYVENLPFLQSCIQKCLANEHVRIVDALADVFSNLSLALNDDSAAVTQLSGFFNFVESIIVDGLQNGRNIYGMTAILKTLPGASPDYVSHLLKVFQRLCKEYPMPTVAQTPAIPTIVAILVTCIQLLNENLAQLGDTRKTYMACLATLMERSNELKIHQSILDVLREWIFSPVGVGSTLSLKEKCTMIQKFAVLERRAEKSTFDEYMKMISQVYENETFSRTELTVRLEPIFLLGTRYDDATIRNKFLCLFDRLIPKSLFIRYSYILGVQSWESIGNTLWLRQGLEVLFAIAKSDVNIAQKLAPTFQTLPIAVLDTEPSGQSVSDTKITGDLARLVEGHQSFLRRLQQTKLSVALNALRAFLHMDRQLAHQLWVEMFACSWECFSVKERHDLNKIMIALLTRDYHLKQAASRPNVVQGLVEGLINCNPRPGIPPHLSKYLAKHFDTWYSSLDLLGSVLDDCAFSGGLSTKSSDRVKEAAYDSVAEIYSLLSEDDLFFGLWRRRCLFPETNAALSLEQVGMWEQAQKIYESVQMKARNGLLPFAESEYSLFEDRWISCTKKLQQWDLLLDFAKHDNNVSLQLECSWRITDWNADRESLSHLVSIVAEPPTPRTKIYEAFLALSQIQENTDKLSELQRVCDEGLQTALKKWLSLPSIVSNTHIPLLHSFQQFVELQEASHVYIGVGPSNIQGKLQAIQELKGTLGTWRDRLPNVWDDINIWSELVAWRQHVFSVINKAYQPLIDQQQGVNSLAYRGYHEIAWIINRFAHVARKHHLIDVCINALTKIYTLPNIEIHDAFLKLREQAKCYTKTHMELSTGLDVINNTNLGYFQQAQRAEFFALKGKFLAQLNLKDEANQAFSSALQIDMNLPKGWAAWGQYNDRMFTQDNTNVSAAANAVNCYLNAAGLFKNIRARKYLGRVLWLLGFDDESGTIANGFDSYKGEITVWYWITFVPQLLNALARPEAKHAKFILIKIAKTYPQALYFSLRTAREDFANAVLNRAEVNSTSQAPIAMDEDGKPEDAMDTDDTPLRQSNHMDFEVPDQTAEDNNDDKKQEQDSADETTTAISASTKPAHEHIEDVMAILRTGYPLLTLTLETLVDQILARLKPSPEEDLYRMLSALTIDAFQTLLQCFSSCKPGDKPTVTSTTKAGLMKLISSPFFKLTKHHAAMEEDLCSCAYLEELISKYSTWRDLVETILDCRPRKLPLEHFSQYLVEFEHKRFDDVEVPGQYQALRDHNNDFIRIERFLPEVDFVRDSDSWHRRIHVIAHDGSRHSFSILNPTSRFARREERIVQLFRLLNGVLEKRKESRRRNATFHLPTIVPLSPTVRLMQNDSSYVSLQGILTQYCVKAGHRRDEPLLWMLDRLKKALEARGESFASNPAEYANLKMELFNEIGNKVVPPQVLSKFMCRAMASSSDYWTLRRQFTVSYAAATFMQYVMSIGHRLPQKIHISCSKGNVWVSDLLPLFNSSLILHNPEAVPFRLSPNLQHFMTDLGIEGLFCGSLVAIGMSLTEPEYKLDHYLGLFMRDEVASLQSMTSATLTVEELRMKVEENINVIVQRATELSCKERREVEGEINAPVIQTLIEKISDSTNPEKLCSMDGVWHPWM